MKQLNNFKCNDNGLGIKVKAPSLVGFFAAILFFQVIAMGLPTANAQTPEIPDWIRTTAEFWIDRQTSDTEFVNALQFLVTQGILHIPQTTSPIETAPPTVTAPEIPDWIRTTSKYWIDRQISDTEFVNALQYLVTQRILHIPQSTSPTVTLRRAPHLCLQCRQSTRSTRSRLEETPANR